LIETEWGAIIEQRPVIYQMKDSKRMPIRGEYVLTAPDSFGFKLKDIYDTGARLIIDPLLIYSTYLGGSDDEEGNAVAIDAAGNTYITGHTESADFPTKNPYQGTVEWGIDVFVTKLNNRGDALVYSTYLGGNHHDESAGIAVDAAGRAHVTGYTRSTDFPIENPYQEGHGGGDEDAFAVKLNIQGNGLIYSTYLGGSDADWGKDLALDSQENACITGFTGSDDFPTEAPYQASNGGYADVFVTKFNAGGDELVYSTYLGGGSADGGEAIDLDAADNVYITGLTGSTDFPIENPFQSDSDIWGEIFVTKLNATCDALVYSTYLGESGYIDWGYGIAVDSDGQACVTGYTGEIIDFTGTADVKGDRKYHPFPTKNAYQSTSGGGRDAFVTKFNAGGDDVVYSTFLGGSGHDDGSGIAVDAEGHAFVTGFTVSSDFPIRKAYQGDQNTIDAFVTQLSAQGHTLNYSTYIGGSGSDKAFDIALDSDHCAYITGYTRSADFPIQNPYQSGTGGSRDVFVTKFSPPGVPAWLEETTDFDGQPQIEGNVEQTFQKKE